MFVLILQVFYLAFIACFSDRIISVIQDLFPKIYNNKKSHYTNIPNVKDKLCLFGGRVVMEKNGTEVFDIWSNLSQNTLYISLLWTVKYYARTLWFCRRKNRCIQGYLILGSRKHWVGFRGDQRSLYIRSAAVQICKGFRSRRRLRLNVMKQCWYHWISWKGWKSRMSLFLSWFPFQKTHSMTYSVKVEHVRYFDLYSRGGKLRQSIFQNYEGRRKPYNGWNQSDRDSRLF